MERMFSTGEVARLLGVRPYRITYAISTGRLADASFRFLAKRCFTRSDIERVAQHFGSGPVDLVVAGDQPVREMVG